MSLRTRENDHSAIDFSYTDTFLPQSVLLTESHVSLAFGSAFASCFGTRRMCSGAVDGGGEGAGGFTGRDF